MFILKMKSGYRGPAFAPCPSLSSWVWTQTWPVGSWEPWERAFPGVCERIESWKIKPWLLFFRGCIRHSLPIMRFLTGTYLVMILACCFCQQSRKNLATRQEKKSCFEKTNSWYWIWSYSQRVDSIRCAWSMRI